MLHIEKLFQNTHANFYLKQLKKLFSEKMQN